MNKSLTLGAAGDLVVAVVIVVVVVVLPDVALGESVELMGEEGLARDDDSGSPPVAFTVPEGWRGRVVKCGFLCRRFVTFSVCIRLYYYCCCASLFIYFLSTERQVPIINVWRGYCYKINLYDIVVQDNFNTVPCILYINVLITGPIITGLPFYSLILDGADTTFIK